jgi:hypothetical protein
MLKYEYINKEWIVSPTARRVYRASAVLSVALFFGWWAILFVGGVPSTSPRCGHSASGPFKTPRSFAETLVPGKPLHPLESLRTGTGGQALNIGESDGGRPSVRVTPLGGFLNAIVQT